MHHYPFHIGDYRGATAHLSNEEDLAYRRLLDMYYDTEQPIPLGTQWVARRLRLETGVVEKVLDDMFECTDEGWRQARCDDEIARYKAIVERNRTNGKSGGRPTSGKKRSKRAMNGNPVGSQSEPSVVLGSSLNSEEKRSQILTGLRAERFAEWWDRYNYKLDKAPAERAFLKVPQEIIEDDKFRWPMFLGRTRNYVEATPNKKTRKYPASWLNAKGWEDEEPPHHQDPEPDKRRRPVEHIRNLPIGTPSCGCADCENYRKARA